MDANEIVKAVRARAGKTPKAKVLTADEIVAKVRAQNKKSGAAVAPKPSASAEAAGALATPAPLPRLKGDARPVEPVEGVSAVAPTTVAPESGVPASRGLSALFAKAKQSVAEGRAASDLLALASEGAATAENAITTGVKKSVATAGRDVESAKALGGSGDAAAFVKAGEEIAKIKYEAELEQQVREFGQEQTFTGKLARLGNPAVAMALLSEQATNVGISIGSSVAGAVAGSMIAPGPGTAVGFAGGAVASGAIGKATEVVPEFMQEKGIDPSNEEQVRGFFANPQAMRELREYAAKAGIALGVIDGIVSLVGAKGAGSAIAKPFVKPFLKKADAVPGPLAEGVGAFGLETAGSGLSEAAASLASRGYVNVPEVYDEMLLGGIANVGQATIATIISRNERSGRAPTAEEIRAAAGEEGIPLPETFVTPEEAEAEGRTLYGFAENDSQNPVELGSYDEAEAKAGAGDIRRGKIIAVKPEEATSAVAAVTVDDVIAAVNSKQSSALKTVKDRIKALFPTAESTVNSAIQKAVNKYDQVVYIQKQDPAAATEVLKTEVTTALELLPKIRTYSGDRKNRGVKYSERNEVTFSDVDATYGRAGIRFGQGTIASKKLNLDRLQKTLREKNWKLVPINIKRMIYGDQRMEKLVDTTFKFTTPEARQKFIDGDIDDRLALMKSGDVDWAGKLDGRFIAGTINTSFDQTELAILDETGNDLPADQVKAFLDGLTEAATDTSNQRDAVWESGRRYSASAPWASPAVVSEFDAQFTGGQTAKHYEVNSATFAKFRTLFAAWHEKFRIKRRTIYIEARRLNKYDKAAQWVWPNGFQTDMPITFATLIQVSGSDGYNGMHIDISDNARVVILVTDAVPRSDAEVYSTLTHEFGHVISSEHFASAPLEVRNKIFAAYRRFVLANPLTQAQYEQFRRRRFAAAKWNYNFAGVKSQKDYFISFEEWFAEQTARWADTNARPLGVVGKFFRELSRKIVALYRDARKQFGKLDARAEFEMEQFLNSVWDGSDVLTNWPENAVRNFEATSQAINSKVDPAPLPQHQMTANVSSVLKSVENQPFVPPAQRAILAQTRAGVDRFGWFSDWALNLRQVASRNPHIQELQLINELFDFAKNDASRIMVEAEGYLKRWRRRSRKQQEALNKLIFELNDMSYLQPDEQPRWPTPQEFADMVRRLELDADTLALYRDIRDFFLNSLRRQEELQIAEAQRITDPALRTAAIKSAQDASRLQLQKPYFPQMRFGKYALWVKTPTGEQERFETFETKRELEKRVREAMETYPEADGWSVQAKVIPDDVRPFMGVPPWMLDKLREMPGMTPGQQDWLEAFRYAIAPATSHRKRMMKRNNVKGYSLDGQRVFANYAFHHGRFYSRIKHDWDLRQAIDSLKHSVPPGLGVGEVNERAKLGNFAERVYSEFRNPSNDWAGLRILNAIWHLGYVPASAIVNLTQTVLATAPYLSAKFGNVKGEAALMNATRKLSTYYKQGTYKTIPDDEFRAIAKAVEDGHIDESMAAELAAMAVGSGSSLKVGGLFATDKLSRGWREFVDKGMWMFRMAEQWNRRVSFRAARQLAFDNPSNEYVQNMRMKYFLQYDQLKNSGWTDREALAYLTAVDVLKETHFTYDAMARPRFMQGKKSVLFAFYMFTQNSLFMLWNNKDMLARYMLYMAIIAGPMGLVPDDAEDLLNAIGRKLFGDQFNLEREARKLIVNLLDDESTVPPDLLLHGASRYSFGLAKAADFLGAKFVPDVDMSKSMAISRVTPLNITSLLRPAADWNEQLANLTRDAAGAAYGIPLAVGKAILGSDLDIADFKRWESAMPRAFRQATRATRLAAEGGERNNQGAQTLSYDYSEPKEFGELLAIAAGFTPTKQSQYWDRTLAEKELDLFWDAQRKMIFKELYESKFLYDDKDGFKEAVEKMKTYNLRAPPGYKITGEAVKQSLRNRQKARLEVERGGNPFVKPAVEQEVQRLYPEGAVIHQKEVK